MHTPTLRPSRRAVMLGLAGAVSTPAFAQRIESWRQRIEAHLDRTLGESDPPTSRLRAAMRYAVLGGGGTRHASAC